MVIFPAWPLQPVRIGTELVWDGRSELQREDIKINYLFRDPQLMFLREMARPGLRWTDSMLSRCQMHEEVWSGISRNSCPLALPILVYHSFIIQHVLS